MTSTYVEGAVRTAAYRALTQDRFAGPKHKRASLSASLIPLIRELSGVCEENARLIVDEAIEVTEPQSMVMASDRADLIASAIGEALGRGSLVRA